MTMSMGFSLRQSLKHEILIQMPVIQWSLLTAYQSGQAGPPPYVPPTFEEEEFTPVFKTARRKIAGFDQLDHVAKMRRVDEVNAVYRFAYTQGEDSESGDKKGYFKIPLMRDFNADIDKIKIRISAAEFYLATGLLKAVGQMERIAHTVPYFGLYKSVQKHLKKRGAKLDQVVLVSVDRGGRLPCIILQRALNLLTMESLKVDQGSHGDGIDGDKIEDFIKRGVLRGKHVLFVDSTVDSGRQINAIKRFFEPRKVELGFLDWSIVGSNEYGQSLDERHSDINWGVNPDETFEDNPQLMGIDYDGCHTKVKECPTEASIAIRECLMSVPDGWYYEAEDIAEETVRQLREWKKRQIQRRAEHRRKTTAGRQAHRDEVEKFRAEEKEARRQAKAEHAVVRKADRIERELVRITSSKTWRRTLSADDGQYPPEALPETVPNGQRHQHMNILVVGSGQQDLPQDRAQFVADNLGPHCSLLAGTPNGNPGAVLKATLANPKVPVPEVRLYQPGYQQGRTDGNFGGVPVKFAGGDKDAMRQQMVADSQAVLALGGREGTLREVLLALDAGKPTLIVRGYGPVAEFILQNRRLRKNPSLIPCSDLTDAVMRIYAMSAA